MEDHLVNMNNSSEIDGSSSNSQICRLCLVNNPRLRPLFHFEEVDTKSIPLSMLVTMCTSIKVSKFDGLPKGICNSCFTFVRDWYEFRLRCRKSESELKKNIRSVSNNLSKQINVPSTSVDCDIALSLRGSDSDNSMDKVILNLDRQNQDDDLSSSKPTAPMKQRLKCSLCPDSFYFLKDLKIHEGSVHSKEVESKTRASVESLKNVRPNLKINRRIKTRYEMRCCGKLFINKSQFRHHLWKKHPGEKPFSCDVCGKKDFISEETLKRHKMLHTGRYSCEICGRTFTCHAILRIHERDKHENDRPFVCDVCGKAFVTELLLSYHQRFHTGEKKYVCEECGVAVVTSSSLAKHKRTHSKIKPHVCGMCGKGFIVRGRLIEHIRVHTGERPFVCEICSKTFTMQDKLKRHMRSHTDQKPFSCEICGNAYSTSHGLSVHLKSHNLRN